MMTRPPARRTTSAAPVRSSTERVSPMPERSASVTAPARRAPSAAMSAASVSGCVEAGKASSLLKLALSATSRPSHARNSRASRQAATALARSGSRATTTRPRSGAGQAESGTASIAAEAAAPCRSRRRDSVSTSRLYRAVEAPPPSARPRDESPHVALRPARGGVDPKARRLHGALGLAVPVTAAGQTRPERLPAVLHPRLEAAARAHVLEHPQRAGGLQHAPDLGESARGLRHAAEGEPADDRVERAVPKRQRLGVALHERDAGRPTPRGEQRVVRRIEARDPGVAAVERKVAAGAATDVERASGRALDEPAAPASEAEALDERAAGVVQPGDLLNATHRTPARDASAEVVEQQVHEHARHGDVEPDRQRPPRERHVTVELSRERAIDGREDERDHDGGQHDVRDEDRKSVV